MRGRALLWGRTGPFLLTFAGFGVAVFMASHRFAEHTSQMKWFRWNSESYSGSDRQQTTTQWPWPLFGASLALGDALELFLSPPTELVISGCCLKSTFHHTSTIQSRNGLLTNYRIREDNISKWWSFWFMVGSRGIHLPSFFTFPISFKCQVTVWWSVLSSSAASHVLVKRSISVLLSTGRCQFPVASYCLSHLQGYHLLCGTSWTTTACTFVSSP